MSDTRPLRFQDLMAIERITSPAVSPDGRRVAFVTARHDPEENTVERTVRMVDLASGDSTELTPGPGNHHSPAWSPDGAWLALVSDRDPERGSQIWVLPTAGGEARRVTEGHGGAGTPVWAPDSRRIAFSRSVVVSADYDESADGEVDPVKGPSRAKVHGLVNPKSSARVADALLFRHWDHWRDRRRSHVFVVDVVSGECTDLTPGDRDAPPISLDSPRDYAFSPDGRQLAFVMNPDAVVARSTNNCIWLLPLEGTQPAGEARNVSITEACDNHPRFSPDGRRLAWLGMAKPVHEADKTRLRVLDLPSGEVRTFLEDFDRSPHAFQWRDDDSVVLMAQDRGRQSLYRLDLCTGEVVQLTLGTHNGPFALVPGSDRIVAGRQSTTSPTDLWLIEPGAGIPPVLAPGPLPPDLPDDAGATAARITCAADALTEVELHPAEEFWYEGDGGVLQHGFLVRPPGFDPARRWPLILLVHGGPQGAFSDDFHFRWNAQMFAAQGAVVAFLNPTGSTGYGQELTDRISEDWGGACYRDLMLGLDAILARFPFVDPERLGAAGASFGGFMINWFLGHTDRFEALVCHDGVFASETMAYTTEELWFDDVEHGGLPHEDRSNYLEHSPHLHVARFGTPTLVVHGELDFRCPISEGLGLFTALQVMGVPSRLLLFPDEGHWVTQPANAQVWYHEVVGWLMHHLDGDRS